MKPICQDCRRPYLRLAGECWRTLCNDCYEARQRPRFDETVPSSVDPFRAEFNKHLPAMIRLAFPDRHPEHAQTIANEVTAWLLNCRAKQQRGKT